MKTDLLFEAIGEAEERKVEAAGKRMSRTARRKREERGRKKTFAFASRPAAALLAAALVLGIGFSVYALEMDRRYNAAVGYLNSLGIEAEDLSDYSRAEVREAAELLRATEPAPASNSEKYMALYNKVYANSGAAQNSSVPPERPTAPLPVTSGDVRKLTPTMTAKEVTDLLGNTLDIGSGFLILRYEVDGEYTLDIPFAGLDAQLGVTGETLLKALQPKTE